MHKISCGLGKNRRCQCPLSFAKRIACGAQSNFKVAITQSDILALIFVYRSCKHLVAVHTFKTKELTAKYFFFSKAKGVDILNSDLRIFNSKFINIAFMPSLLKPKFLFGEIEAKSSLQNCVRTIINRCFKPLYFLGKLYFYPKKEFS